MLSTEKENSDFSLLISSGIHIRTFFTSTGLEKCSFQLIICLYYFTLTTFHEVVFHRRVRRKVVLHKNWSWIKKICFKSAKIRVRIYQLNQRKLSRNGFQQKGFSERLFPRILERHLELYQTAPRNIIIDIWKGPNVFELVDVSYYNSVPLSLTKNLSAANVLEYLQLRW